MIRTIRGWGAEGLEVWLGHLYDESVTEIKRLIRQEGLEYRVHADIRDINLTSSNPGIRAESLKQMLVAVETTATLEASVLTLHPGRLSSTKDRSDAFWPVLIEQMSVIAAKARQLGVIVGVENMERRSKEFVLAMDDIRKLLDGVDNPFMGHTLDVAHAHSVDNVLTFLSKVDYSRVVNVHISQASKQRMHLPMAEGDIAIKQAIREVSRNYCGLMVIESYKQGNESEQLKQNIAALQRIRSELANEGTGP